MHEGRGRSRKGASPVLNVWIPVTAGDGTTGRFAIDYIYDRSERRGWLDESAV